MKIIVTGSLGHIGKPLAMELVQQGHTITVISSKEDKRQSIEATGATAAIGSLEDPVFLTETFNGADAVFAMVPPKYNEPDAIAYYRRIGKAYAQAAKAAGVKHIVHLSSYGADLDAGTGIILGSHNVEEILNELPDVAATHLRPGYFYYNLYNFAGMLKGQGIIGSNYGGDDKLVLVAPSDIATAAAEELTKFAVGKTVRYVASDERTCNEIASIVGAAIGKPDLTWLTFTDEQTKAGMEQNGMPPHFAATMVELGSAIHKGILLTDYEKHKPARMGKIKLEDFAKEFAAAF